jgi:hypothetical protein
MTGIFLRIQVWNPSGEQELAFSYNRGKCKAHTYSLIFWSTSHGECQVTRSRFRKPEENHSESMPFSTPFISCKGEERG